MDGIDVKPLVQNLLVTWTPRLLMAAMGASFFVLFLRYLVEPFAPGADLRLILRGQPSQRQKAAEAAPSLATRRMRTQLRRNEMTIHNQAKLLLWILLTMALSRMFIFACALIGALAAGEARSFLLHPAAHWLRWDALDYLKLARAGYAPEVGYLLVYFPLYPLTVRLLAPLFLMNEVAAAFALSNCCLFVAGWALYHLTLDAQGERAAKRAVRLLMFCPLSVFFSVPYAESMFLMLTLLSVLLARRRNFSLAIFLGLAAACTRLLGVCVAVPVYLEMLRHARSDARARRTPRRYAAKALVYAAMCLPILLGLGLYLLLNLQYAGNPLQFLDYQAGYFNQSPGSMLNCVRYTFENALQFDTWQWWAGTWLPQSITIVIIVGLILATSPRIHPGDGAYLWLYVFLAFSSTWLLAGPRYVASAYALYPTLSSLLKRRWQNAAIMAIFALLTAATSILYAVFGSVL